MKPYPVYLAACLAVTTTACPAQSRKTSDSAAPMSQVEIKAKAEDYDPRRDDTASKTVITSAEIMKCGDTNVFDVLKRAPGVTVIGNSIRMRGLGNGYTQVLVNGETPPPGFSMDALTPDRIERIDVMRAATAEHSMRAIAGTINIVLRKVVSRAQRDLRINLGRSNERKDAFLIGTLADRRGKLSYYLNGMLGRSLDDMRDASIDSFTLPDDTVLQSRDASDRRRNATTWVGLNPRLNWKLDNDGQLNVNTFVQSQRGENGADRQTVNRIGQFPQPDYVRGRNASDQRSHFLGAELNWVAKLGGGKLDAKLSASGGRTKVDARAMSSTADGGTRLLRDRFSQERSRNAGSTGKYTRTLFEGHALASGWELASQRSEEQVARVEGLSGSRGTHIHERFEPVVRRAAMYAQDEWNVTRQWSMYLGARWEVIRTDSDGSGLVTSASRSQVLTPVAQTLYKFPDKRGRQLRMALTRTYKAPTVQQLSARRIEAELNTRFNPDHSGNPALQPELARGLDLSYEHFWAPGAVFSVGTSYRRIEDTIRNKLTYDRTGYWLNQPVNEGRAYVRTLDMELKFPLKAVIKHALPIDLRASANRNWSTVDGIPGPYNRLDQQVPLTAVLGADFKGNAFSAGASFAFRAGGPVQVSAQQLRRMYVRRELEAYGLYKIRTGLQLRIAVSNALGEDNLSYSRYRDTSGASETWTRSAGSPRLQLNLEIKH